MIGEGCGSAEPPTILTTSQGTYYVDFPFFGVHSSRVLLVLVLLLDWSSSSSLSTYFITDFPFVCFDPLWHLFKIHIIYFRQLFNQIGKVWVRSNYFALLHLSNALD